MNINIKNTFTFFLFVISLVGCLQKNQDPYLWVRALPNPWSLSEEEFENFLPEFHKKYPDFHERLIAINLWRVGTPYQAFCLGEEGGVDTDPIIRIDSSDCTIHVLTSIVFAESHSWENARELMVKLHYKSITKESTPTYSSRWHFTSDRILNHGRTPNMTDQIVDKSLMKFVEIDLNRKNDGTEFLDLNWTSKEKIGYLPTEKVSEEILQKLPSICGVAFVKESYFKMGVVIAHEGFILDKGTFIHASSEQKKTVSTQFLNYLIKEEKPRFDGVMFYEIIEN